MSDQSFSSKELLSPPQVPKENLPRDWLAIKHSDSVIEHIENIFWDQDISPANWLAARLSPAVYVYCEKATGLKIIAKFHAPKTGKDAVYHAEREFRITLRAWKYLSTEKKYRSIQPLESRKGVLFLEYVEGFTLEDQIAIRRSQPGELFHSLEAVAKLLSQLHTESVEKESETDFVSAVNYAYKVLDNLVKHGVLQNHPSVQNGIKHLIEKWNHDQDMWDFRLALNHGDATSSNFIFPMGGGVVAIDWERSEFADPAADLGRLMAEVTHAINQQGGDYSEGYVYAQELGAAYSRFLPRKWDQKALLHRARFYEAISTLRIARNGWLSRKDRLALVLQAFALLSR
jgi:thiamine kinase-like enzyme